MCKSLSLFSLCCILTLLIDINNAGSIAQALYADNNPDYDEVKSAQLQALQVSTISVMNCAGRILIGIIADITKNYFKLPRSFCISLVAFLFVISQIAVYMVEDVNNLWKASALLGLAYGSLFGLFPTITIEWFGLRKYMNYPECVFANCDLCSCMNSSLLRKLGLCLPLTHARR